MNSYGEDGQKEREGNVELMNQKKKEQGTRCKEKVKDIEIID